MGIPVNRKFLSNDLNKNSNTKKVHDVISKKLEMISVQIFFISFDFNMLLINFCMIYFMFVGIYWETEEWRCQVVNEIK